ncbi:hypothetical protein R3W88_011963 [Solanum pinnatisectum]|uniref:Uncharacterized protein n=1 Tax=Solanum pinnatisectum TaxID=50273 RepID=A0AAV9LB99_9SOLN|nr:hypothetical protein R3W88_011963 [Solanum pinnatisectum]
MVESIGAISLLGRVLVYGVNCNKDASSKRKSIDLVCGSNLLRLRGDCVRFSLIRGQAMELTKKAFSYKEDERLSKDFRYRIETDVDKKPGKWPPTNKADNPALHNPLLRQERMGCGWLATIFECEGVLTEDNPDLEKQAWLALSQEEGKSPPPGFILKRIEGMKNEQAISKDFCWSRDPVQVKRMATQKVIGIGRRLGKLYVLEILKVSSVVVAGHVSVSSFTAQDHIASFCSVDLADC